MNLELIQAFLAALDYESFSEAAKARFVTGPTQSKQIKALETELGLKLFKRTSQGMVPTDAARALAPKARDIATAAGQLKEEADDLRANKGGRIVVGISGFDFEHRIVAFIMERLNEKFGHTDLTLSRLDMMQQVEAVRKGECDAAFMTTTGELSSSDVHATELMRLPACLEVPATHPFARRQSVSVSELADETLIINEEAYVYSSYRNTMNVLADSGVGNPRIKHIRNYLDAPAYVASGQGLAFTCHLTTPAVENVVKVPIEGGALTTCVTLITAETPANPLVEPFTLWAQEWARAFGRSAA